MEKGPIFIGGLDRSGKTTLRAFLQSHPNISIPAVGSNLWTYFYRQFGDLRSEENFERCLEAMMTYKQVRFLQPDLDRLRCTFWQGPQTYARLFALLQEQHATREGKPRWGDQTGLIERYAGPIFAAYPGAKMIHMVRDPRDRYAGSLALWPKGKGRAGGAAARWLYSSWLARRNLRRYPGRYMLVRFESMVTQPEATLRSVCEFLDEEYIPAMLNMPGAPEHREKLIARSGGSRTDNPLSSEYIGIYAKHIPQQEIAFIQWVLSKPMADMGYLPSALSFRLRDWMIFWLKTVPLNLVRMLFWLLFESVQQNLPALFGRKPGKNMRVGKGGSKQASQSQPAGSRHA